MPADYRLGKTLDFHSKISHADSVDDFQVAGANGCWHCLFRR
jgi:hypothetical protein